MRYYYNYENPLLLPYGRQPFKRPVIYPPIDYWKSLLSLLEQ